MPINNLKNLARFTSKIVNDIQTGKHAIRYAELSFEALMEKTPILHGFARGNWFFSTGSKSGRVEETYNKFGNIAYAGIPSVLEPSKPLFLFNNLHYIVPLEEGKSKQAPYGFLKQSVEQARLRWRSEYAA